MRKFGGPKNIGSIPKYDLDKDGNPITEYNNRTMMKKAFEAFLLGKDFYKYKGKQYAVPIIFEKD